MRMQKYGRPETNNINMHGSRTWRRRYSIATWFPTKGFDDNSNNETIQKALNPGQIQRNTTRGLTPGLIDPSRGPASPSVPRPALGADEGFHDRLAPPHDLPAGTTWQIGHTNFPHMPITRFQRTQTAPQRKKPSSTKPTVQTGYTPGSPSLPANPTPPQISRPPRPTTIERGNSSRPFRGPGPFRGFPPRARPYRPARLATAPPDAAPIEATPMLTRPDAESAQTQERSQIPEVGEAMARVAAQENTRRDQESSQSNSYNPFRQPHGMSQRDIAAARRALPESIGPQSRNPRNPYRQEDNPSEYHTYMAHIKRMKEEPEDAEGDEEGDR